MVKERTLQPGESDFEGLKNPQDESEQASESLEASVGEATEPSAPATPFIPSGASSDYPVKLQTDVLKYLYEILGNLKFPSIPLIDGLAAQTPVEFEETQDYAHAKLLLDTFGIESMTISNHRHSSNRQSFYKNYSMFRVNKTTKDNAVRYVQALFGQEALDSPLAADLADLPDDEPVEFSALPLIMPHLQALESLVMINNITGEGTTPFNSVYFSVMETEPEARLLIARTLRTGYTNGSIQPPSERVFSEDPYPLDGAVAKRIKTYVADMNLPSELLQKEAQRLGITDLDMHQVAFTATKATLTSRFN